MPRLECPVVGVGASAGGLETFRELLGLLPADTGLAFVLLQHLDPSHTSFLAEALAKATTMPVHAIRDGATIEPNRVYVVAPNADVGIDGSRLISRPQEREARKPHMAIDHFFAALASARGRRAIGVVLSGTGSDGTEGLRSIKAADGVTLVQDPASAKFEGMPRSAVTAGVADECLSIPELAAEIVRLASHPYIVSNDPEPLSTRADEQDVERLLTLLRSATGVDYRRYKTTTIHRRLARRLALHKLDRLRDYLRLVQSDPAEAQALCEDMLIHVTSFFRDPEVFDALKARVFPELVKDTPPKPVRMWVVGCSTGEEVYSLVIAFLEFLGNTPEGPGLQVFGSDVSERAIESARAGLYSDAAVRGVSPERLRRFFARVEGGYRVNKQVRERCVFVRHDVSRDPPFSRMDVVSCRNVLIYFNAALQRQVLALLHYSLNPGRFLVLGRAESASAEPSLFLPLDGVNRIFARGAIPSTLRAAGAGDAQLVAAHPPSLPGAAAAKDTRAVPDTAKVVDALLMSTYAPCGVVVNERLEILQFRGHTGPYLEPAPGQPQLNLLKMARGGLLGPLRTALAAAKKSGAPVRRDGVEVQEQGEATRTCNVVVLPIVGVPEATERLYVVLFEQLESPRVRRSRSKPASSRRSAHASQEAERTAAELSATREYLQSLTEEHQRTNDELSSANEELMSANEELQSMNEELETAKEELQSTNEELSTVNDELQNRNRELGESNDDLVNVLSSVEIPIVILDRERRVRRFTPKAGTLLNLLPGDVGRHVDDIRPNLVVEDLPRAVSDVIGSATMKESEVLDDDGRWHRMQIRPYKTLDGAIEGAVVSVVDIDPLKRALREAEWARDYASSVVEAVQVPLVVLDPKGVVSSANAAFYDLFGGSKESTEGHRIYALGEGAWD
ncbi:MAG TPA: chemotaxis protein CheB, partial [Polyangiaceae bacterium]|nr:chemotaxis protein CheB [Polyangiaceae bacterium]